MTYLVDTNVIREVMRKTPDPRVDAWFRLQARAEHALVLATRNTRDFEGFGIPLFNPFDHQVS